MTNRILSHDQQSSQQQAQQLKLLWTLVVQDNPKLRTAETVRFYKSRYSSLPEDWGEQPVERELQFELRL